MPGAKGLKPAGSRGERGPVAPRLATSLVATAMTAPERARRLAGALTEQGAEVLEGGAAHVEGDVGEGRVAVDEESLGGPDAGIGELVREGRLGLAELALEGALRDAEG